MMKTTVLTLHGIECKSITALINNDPSIRQYTIGITQLNTLLNLLSTTNCSTVQELIESSNNKSISLTFDDGLISDYEIVFPLLNRMKIKATFYLTAKNIGEQGYCDEVQLKEMSNAGMEIGSHGLTHRYLILMPVDESKREIKESKDKIEQIIGKEVNSYAPVGGHFHRWMLAYALDSGYKSFATMIPGKTNHDHANLLKLHRNHIQDSHDETYIKDLIQGNEWFFLNKIIKYYALYLTKVILGMRNYDRLKSLVLVKSAIL